MLALLREIGKMGFSHFSEELDEDQREDIFARFATEPMAEAFIDDLRIKIQKGFSHATTQNTLFSIGNDAIVDVKNLITEEAEKFPGCQFYEAVIRGEQNAENLFNAYMADIY